MRVMVLTACAAITLAGCSLLDGSTKSGGPAEKAARAGRETVTIRFAAADPGGVQPVFFQELARVSSGRVRALPVGDYDPNATDVDQQIARDLVNGRLDVADVGARAWESLGVTGPSAFQSAFLLGSDALLASATADRRVTDPVLEPLAALKLTGLAVVALGPRYVLAVKRPLDSPQAFSGAPIRIHESPATERILLALGAKPTTEPPNGPALVEALRSGQLDAVEGGFGNMGGLSVAAVAPHVSSPIFAKVSTIVANSARLHALGPDAAEWIRLAAEHAAAALAPIDDRTAWLAACGAGLKPSPSSPEQLDALQEAVFDAHATLDGDKTAALAIDRMGVHAVHERAADPWMRCDGGPAGRSPTRPVDGTYEFSLTQEETAAFGDPGSNFGGYRVEIGNGRYALFHLGPADPQWPGWDFARDPVEVGNLLLRGGVGVFRPDTAMTSGTQPKIYRFELFRDRLRWRYVDGFPDFLMDAKPWRRVG